MALYDLVDFIRAKMGSVSGIGKIHDYERAINTIEDLYAYFRYPARDKNRKLNGWTITRESTSSEWRTHQPCVERIHTFVIRGYYSVDDASGSERDFQQLVDDIVDKFNIEDTWSGLCEWTEPMQVRALAYNTFGGVLVHHVELTIDVGVIET